MDTRNEEKHIFNIRLAKLVGLYQMLDPGTVTFLGRNVYQMFAALFLSYELVLTVTLFVSSLRLWTYNTGTILLVFLITSNCFYVCYKMSIVIYRSDDIWDCLSITRYDYTSLSRNRKRNGHDILDLWRSRSFWYTSLLAGGYCWGMVSYVACPLAFGGAVIPIKNNDGSIGNYRLNVLNLYFFTSDETYNEYYNTFYVIEALFILILAVLYLIVDTLFITLCLATCCQMQVICSAFESVHHNSPSDPHSSAIGTLAGTAFAFYRNIGLSLIINTRIYDNTDEKQIISNEHDLIHDELITNIINHQAVIKKYELFLSIFERATLLQIFVSSLSLIILWFNLIMWFFNDGTFAISIVAIPSTMFQIFMTCYLFENVHDQKDSIIFALYSSNWTEMDMKCKKLILLTMKLNNGHQKKLKFTRTKIVNLEMFFKMMGNCYSVISVLMNYMKAKSG